MVKRHSGFPTAAGGLGFARFAVLGFLLLFLSACTRVVVHEGDGEVVVSQKWGFVDVTALTEKKPQIVEVEAFGLTTHAEGISLGYVSSDLVLLPMQDCRFVVWVDENTPVEAVKELAASHDDLCLVKKAAE